MRAPKRVLAASTLCFEAFAVFFGGLVAKDLSSLSHGQALLLFSWVAILCLVASGLLRNPWGYGVGSVLQVVVIGTGYWVHMMYFVGGLFALIWVAALVIGNRLEREVAEIDARLAAERDEA
ncbi:DUF4233 domain-containing protein [Spongisporangium articulatum]|uniref:DUF4233 domain-containing protein n=1 Tax=Spongisporangium articulatum TaxID=3362603 RepID=A0ABW8AN33_9ACTN